MALRRYAIEVANEFSDHDMPPEEVDSTRRTWDYGRCFKNMKRYTNVSNDFYEVINNGVKKLVLEHLEKNPPKGKTIR